MKVKEFPISIYNTLRLSWISGKRLKKQAVESLPVIVSMTTIPSRLHKVHIVVRSVLDGTKQPQKIILWLEETLKTNIPKSLRVLEGDVFEIRYCPGTYSHRKLIHSLTLYPDHPIVTCDDDFIYRKNWLEALYGQHLVFPNRVIANHVRTITYDETGQLLPYKQWVYHPETDQESPLVMAIGGKGVLYPSNAMHTDVFNEALFLELTPKADDLWFKAMTLRKNVYPMLSKDPVKEPIPIMGTQAISLKKENVDKDKNVRQWRAVQEYFDLPKS